MISENDVDDTAAYTRGDEFLKSIYPDVPDLNTEDDFVRKTSPDYFHVVSRTFSLTGVSKKKKKKKVLKCFNFCRPVLPAHLLLQSDLGQARVKPGNRFEPHRDRLHGPGTQPYERNDVEWCHAGRGDYGARCRCAYCRAAWGAVQGWSDCCSGDSNLSIKDSELRWREISQFRFVYTYTIPI
jgi:hypothetical protein